MLAGGNFARRSVDNEQVVSILQSVRIVTILDAQIASNRRWGPSAEAQNALVSCHDTRRSWIPRSSCVKQLRVAQDGCTVRALGSWDVDGPTRAVLCSSTEQVVPAFVCRDLPGGVLQALWTSLLARAAV